MAPLIVNIYELNNNAGYGYNEGDIMYLEPIQYIKKEYFINVN